MEITGNQYARNDWRKLLATRRGTMLVAVICAAVAAAILVVAMQQYRHNVNSEGNSETVLVATGLIQKGTSGDAIASGQLFKTSSIAKRQVSTGAVADTAQLHGKVAAADIYPGQQLTVADFTAGGGLTAQLAPNQRAMTITLDGAHGMLGQLHDGDHVDIYGSLNSELSGARGVPVLRLLMENIQVLRAASGGSGGGLGGATPRTEEGNITLQVPAGEAGVLAYAAGESGNKVWLVLRPPNATAAPGSPITTSQSVLAGGAK